MELPVCSSDYTPANTLFPLLDGESRDIAGRQRLEVAEVIQLFGHLSTGGIRP
jgi:hypothetical protein